MKYDKQDQQGKAAFNELNPHMTQQQEPMARIPGGPQTKTGQDKDRAQSVNIISLIWLSHVFTYSHRLTCEQA
jgi:hypothetical protein